MELGRTFDLGQVYGAAESIKGTRMDNQIRETQISTQKVLTQSARDAVDPQTGQYSAQRHAQILTSAGYPQAAQQLLTQQIETGTKFLNYVGQRLGMVNQQNYPAFKAEIERTGLAPPGILPEQYDEKALYNLSQAMQGKVQEAYSAFEKLATGPDGAEIYGQRNLRTGKVEGAQVVKPTAPKNPIAGMDANGEGFFDPQTGARVLPGVKPRPRATGAGVGGPGGLKASDSNTINRQVVNAFGGLYDPVTGQISGLDPQQAKRVVDVSARASQIYQEGGGSVDHSTAVQRALQEADAGGGQPQPGAPAQPPPANRPPLSSFRTR